MRRIGMSPENQEQKQQQTTVQITIERYLDLVNM